MHIPTIAGGICFLLLGCGGTPGPDRGNGRAGAPSVDAFRGSVEVNQGARPAAEESEPSGGAQEAVPRPEATLEVARTDVIACVRELEPRSHGTIRVTVVVQRELGELTSVRIERYGFNPKGTSMLVAVGPASSCIETTLRKMRFAPTVAEPPGNMHAYHF